MRRFNIFVLIVMLVFVLETVSRAVTNDTVITSDTLEVDYKRFTAVFDGNVVLDDPQMNMKSENMRVVFKKQKKEEKKTAKGDDAMSNVDVRAVTAIGNVRIKTVDRTANCDQAIYLSDSGEVILSGDVELTREGSVLRGNKVTFWLQDDAKMENGIVDKGSVKSVLAEGDVRIKSEKKTAECGKAVYTEASGKVVMTDKAVLHEGGDSLYGDKIVFWLGESGMDTAEATGNVKMVYGAGSEEEEEGKNNGGN